MVMISVLVLLGLGLLTAAILAAASRLFYVEEDPRVAAVLEVLPGANCGGCGYAGCEGYAIAVINDPAIPANRCCAGNAEMTAKVGELAGKAVTIAEPMISFRRCNKREGHVFLRYDYKGVHSCAAAAELDGGMERCLYSCLGLGDCVDTCPFNAVSIADGLAVINPRCCTGCGKCVEICPRSVLELIPVRARVQIPCSTKDKLKSVTDVCQVGCIKCGRCVKVCPAQAITIENNQIRINQEACLACKDACKEACVAACARKALRYVHPRTILAPLHTHEEKETA